MTEVVSLPIFGGLEVHVPDLFVIKMKKGYKLISPTTKTGALTSRAGKKAFKIIKNEKNELFLHEHPHPQIHLKDFNKKDQNIMQKYFPPPPPPAASKSGSKYSHVSSQSSTISKNSFVPPSIINALDDGSISTISSDGTMDLGTDVILPSGKKKYNVYKQPEEEKAEEKRERIEMAAHDMPRIARLARIAAKKVNGSGLDKHFHHIHF